MHFLDLNLGNLAFLLKKLPTAVNFFILPLFFFSITDFPLQILHNINRQTPPASINSDKASIYDAQKQA